MREDLPERCYALNNVSLEIIILQRGMDGYYSTDLGQGTPKKVDALNRQLGVTSAQRLAMEMGSMFGWDVPGANPALYLSKGENAK